MGRIRSRWPLWALMVAVAGVAILFVAFRPFWPGWVERYEQWRLNAPVLAQLGRPAPLTVQGQVPLAALIADIQRATRSDDLPEGLPIFLDRMGIENASTSPTAAVLIGNAANTPVREMLRGTLRQVGLDFVVMGGRVIVGNPAELPEGDR